MTLEIALIIGMVLTWGEFICNSTKYRLSWSREGE